MHTHHIKHTHSGLNTHKTQIMNETNTHVLEQTLTQICTHTHVCTDVGARKRNTGFYIKTLLEAITAFMVIITAYCFGFINT